MAKNKQSPEHGPLSSPIKRPNQPIVQISSSSSQPKNHNDIPHNIAHGLPRVLHPAMLWYSCPNISQIEWWWSTRVKFWHFLFNHPIINTVDYHPLLFLFFNRGYPQRGTNLQPPVPVPKARTCKGSGLKTEIWDTLVYVKKSSLWRLGHKNTGSGSRECWRKRL